MSAKQVRFCQKLVARTHSRIEAYVAEFGERETPEATRQAAYRLVQKRYVRAYLEELRQAACDASKTSIEELAAWNVRAMKANVKRLMTRTGEFLPLDQWPDELAEVIESVETVEILEPDPERRGRKVLKGYTRKVKFTNKGQAAQRLMQWRKMLGADAADDKKGPPPPLVVKGADPEKL